MEFFARKYLSDKKIYTDKQTLLWTYCSCFLGNYGRVKAFIVVSEGVLLTINEWLKLEELPSPRVLFRCRDLKMYISFIFMDPPVGMKLAMKLGCYPINCHGSWLGFWLELLNQCFAEAYTCFWSDMRQGRSFKRTVLARNGSLTSSNKRLWRSYAFTLMEIKCSCFIWWTRKKIKNKKLKHTLA